MGIKAKGDVELKHPAQIALFLALLKGVVEERGFILVERQPSLQFLAGAELSLEDLKDVILGLSVKDCFDGPEPDRDERFSESWTVAEFGPVVGTRRLYLKLSVRQKPGFCKCLSVKLFEERS